MNGCGLLLQGDQLIATSGVTYGKEEDYNGAKVKMGQQVVRISALNQVRAGTLGHRAVRECTHHDSLSYASGVLSI